MKIVNLFLVARSSNGKTGAFEAPYGGSNPPRAAMIFGSAKNRSSRTSESRAVDNTKVRLRSTPRLFGYRMLFCSCSGFVKRKGSAENRSSRTSESRAVDNTKVRLRSTPRLFGYRMLFCSCSGFVKKERLRQKSEQPNIR